MTIKERIAQAMKAELLTVEQVCLLLNFHRITVYKKAKKGEIPGQERYGRTLLFRRTVVLEWNKTARRRDRPGGQVANY